MNDFTKEELQEIYYRLENAPQALEDKIQSLIDNYCPHTDTTGLYTSTWDITVGQLCYGCGKVIELIP